MKEFLALEAESDNVMSKIAASMAADPPAWTWAKDFAQQYRSLRTEILAMYADIEFFGQMKIAALSAKETSRLKKIYGLDYHSKLCEFCLQLGKQDSFYVRCSSYCYLRHPFKGFFKGLGKKGPEAIGLRSIAVRVIDILSWRGFCSAAAWVV